MESIGCLHYSADHIGVLDVECATTSTGLGVEVAEEMAEVTTIWENVKAGASKACSPCLPFVVESAKVSFVMARKTVASDCIKEFGL